MPWIKVRDGWRTQLVHDDPSIAGEYWFRESDTLLLQKSEMIPETWLPVNDARALQALGPVPLDSCTKANALPYDVSVLLPVPRKYGIQARLPSTVHFDVPCMSVTPDLLLEECYLSYTLQEPLISAIGGSGLREQPPIMPVRLIFGYQSSVRAHTGFGLFHIMYEHGRPFGWNVENLDNFLRLVFSGTPGREFLIFQDEDSEERWNLGPVAKARQIIPGTGDQKVHFMVVLEKKDDCYKIVTVFNKAYNAEYKERAQQAVAEHRGASFNINAL